MWKQAVQTVLQDGVPHSSSPNGALSKKAETVRTERTQNHYSSEYACKKSPKKPKLNKINGVKWHEMCLPTNEFKHIVKF